MTGVRSLHRLALACSLGLSLPWLAACADRGLDPDALGDDEHSDEEPAEGEALASCVDEDDCFVQWCVHPAGEPGFCTFACESAAECPAGNSGTASATCLLVGADRVCALDCDAGRSCPSGMRCEMIEAGDGTPRAICF